MIPVRVFIAALKSSGVTTPVNWLHEMNGNAPVHPRNSRHRKLQIARNNLAVLLERIDDDVHAAGRVRRKPNLVRLGIDKTRHLRPHGLTLFEPLVPMQIAVVHHLLVVRSAGLSSRLRQWPSRSGVEIDGIARNRKLLPNLAPV